MHQIIIGFAIRPGGKDFRWRCPHCQTDLVTYVPEGALIADAMSMDAVDPCGGLGVAHHRHQIEGELEGLSRNPLKTREIRVSERAGGDEGELWWG